MKKVDPYQLIDSIKSTLNKNEFQLEIIEINERVRSGSTGSEVIMSVAHYLKNLKETNDQAFQIVKEEIASLIKYLDSIGLIIN